MKSNRQNALLENLESRVLFAVTPVSFGDGGARSVSFLDADGSAVVVAVRGGAATLDLDGANIAQTAGKHGIVVTGDGLTLAGLTVDNAVDAKIAISARGGNGSVDLGEIGVNGTLAAFSAKTANLTGDFNADDAGTIVLGSITGGAINDAGTALPLKIVIVGDATGAELNAAGSVDLLRAGSWSSGGGANRISALSIRNLQVAGSLDTTIDLFDTGLALASAKIGSITGGRWNINGSAGKIVASATAAGWTATLAGSVASLNAVDLSGDFSAESIARIKAAVISDAHITVSRAYDGTDSLGALTAGSISHSSVRGNSNIAVIRAGSIDSSIFTTGVGTATNVDFTSDFTNPAVIGSFRTATFSNSAVIADTIGAAILGQVDDAAPTLPFFGVAAQHIADLRLTKGANAARLTGLTSASDVIALLAQQGVAFSNFLAEMPGGISGGNGLSNDAARLTHISVALDQIIALRDKALDYAYESSALRGKPWDPQLYFETYMDIFATFQDIIQTRDALDNASLGAGLSGVIGQARTNIVTSLRHEATAIPIEAQEDGWESDYNVLANQFDALV